MRKNALVLFYLFISFSLFAQINVASKQIYLDSLGREATRENYSYTRVFTNFSQKSDRFLVTDYYRSGRKKMTGTSLTKDVLKKEGEFVYYYKNGAKESSVNYSDDHKTGKEYNWYENQSMKSEKQNLWNPKTKTLQTLLINFWNRDKEQLVIDGNGEYEDTDPPFYEKGIIKNGVKQGVWQGSDTINNTSFTENYDKGVLLSGVSTDENNIKHPYASSKEKSILENNGRSIKK
ncbi:hypothetical protein GKZ90_0008140 [Flavobacterium sp. MC2016-06]|uniref:hypothetical protein n=1 Tax=Flavobacterium sp. MC2016-06 TaxID=2676308 RepID=UPI0012BAE4A5|nr:hypothetical protein [Flavobacterium sp. MC2016-06]MBU3858000.1 hypothetical protein [Flavobacterium sp. MC2016-06]